MEQPQPLQPADGSVISSEKVDLGLRAASTWGTDRDLGDGRRKAPGAFDRYVNSDVVGILGCGFTRQSGFKIVMRSQY